jgi:hypothetical protein
MTAALSFLRGFMQDPINMMIIRTAVAEELSAINTLSTSNISRMTDQQILQQFAQQVSDGYIKLVPQEEKSISEIESQEFTRTEESVNPIRTEIQETQETQETPEEKDEEARTDLEQEMIRRRLRRQWVNTHRR